jgi:thiol-disulfide isomerase/thioredoxin
VNTSFPRSRRAAIIAVVGVSLGLVACGGDDTADGSSVTPSDSTASTTDSSTPDSQPSTTAAGSSDGSGDGPVSTLSPDVPAEYLAGIGPVDVIGDPLPNGTNTADDPAIGLSAPTLVGYDLDGEPIRIDPAADGPMMLVFLAHWCSHCNAEVPRLNELRDEGRFPDGLEIVAVATGSRPDAPNWPPTDWLQDTMDWTYPTMLDGIDMEAGSYIAYDAYGVEGFPTIVLIDEDGKVAMRWSGEREPDEVVALIEEYLDL